MAVIFGANLARARDVAGLSQNALATRAGRARSYISAVESGRWNLTLGTAEHFALHVGQTLPDLLNPDWSPTGSTKAQVGDVLPPFPDTLSIELPSGAAFAAARIIAPRLQLDILLIDPATRMVVAGVSKANPAE